VGETIILKHTFDGFQNPQLEHYLHQRGKRFVLTAGLLTSTCVLLTTASAMQKGFLVALVENCCADEPEAHKHTLDHSTFIFERTAVGLITRQHAEWMAALEQLDAVKASFHKDVAPNTASSRRVASERFFDDCGILNLGTVHRSLHPTRG